MSPSQDTVMGCYYITIEKPDCKGEGMVFADAAEAEFAFQQKVIDLHARIKVRLPKGRRLKTEDDSARFGAVINTTFGRILFNAILPQGMDYYNLTMKSGDLASVISDCYSRLGRRATIKLLDDMNQLGFRESTRSGLSFGTDDLVTPE
jgi:DNA-directed RNA polymerase subunit beta'